VTSLRPLAIAAGPAAVAVLPVLRRALDGEFAVLPYAAGGPPPTVPDRVDSDRVGSYIADRDRVSSGAAGSGDPAPDEGTALVVGTSGSTGTPKLAMLSATALAASARATHERLGGPGSWLLAMPPHHIAGVQVLLRCLAAGTDPGFVDLSDGFTSEAFTEAAAGFRGDRRYTALVPTQLVRLLDDAAATEALSRFDAVLVGGAATPPALLARAREAGVRVVTTYGMSETCGGCVYDGLPLSATTVRVDDEDRIHLGGDTLATGYLGRPDLTAEAFSVDGQGRRWFRTDDVGHRDDDGRWHVDGRVDDLITTGGLKVSPRLVEDALTGLPGIAEAVVVGARDPQWGQAVCAAVILSSAPSAAPPAAWSAARSAAPALTAVPPTAVPPNPSSAAEPPATAAPTVGELREQLRGILPAHALPRRLLVLTTIPLRGPGKPDRAAVAALFADDA
jgi:O-succinylbenzoic acid--CoA ligase